MYFNEFYDYPSRAQFRYLYYQKKDKNFLECFVKVGCSLYLDESKYLKWIAKYGKDNDKPKRTRGVQRQVQ